MDRRMHRLTDGEVHSYDPLPTPWRGLIRNMNVLGEEYSITQVKY